MAKVKTTDYVKTLHALIDGCSPEAVKSQFAGFLTLLKKNRDLDQLPFILDLYGQKLDLDQGILDVKVYYPDQTPDSALCLRLSEFAQHAFAAKNTRLIFINRPYLRAGYIIEAAGRQYNLSLHHQLRQFKQQLLQG